MVPMDIEISRNLVTPMPRPKGITKSIDTMTWLEKLYVRACCPVYFRQEYINSRLASKKIPHSLRQELLAQDETMSSPTEIATSTVQANRNVRMNLHAKHPANEIPRPADIIKTIDTMTQREKQNLAEIHPAYFRQEYNNLIAKTSKKIPTQFIEDRLMSSPAGITASTVQANRNGRMNLRVKHQVKEIPRPAGIIKSIDTMTQREMMYLAENYPAYFRQEYNKLVAKKSMKIPAQYLRETYLAKR